jgi:hypothetical protein
MVNEAMQPNTLPALSGSLGKKQIAALVQQSVENALDDGNVAQVAEALAVMELFVNSIRKDERFIDGIRDDLSKNHGALKTASGARIEACEGGIVYDYSENPGWCYLNEQIAHFTEQRKELEAKLRQIPGGKIVVDEETGEVFTGPLKSSKSTYRITLAK